jgi:diguanylate cyclase (GGDEF)-like protein
LRLTHARAGTASKPLLGGSTLSPDDSSVHFEFSLFAFEREYAVRYRTRLEGLESTFGAWTADNTATFPRLPPGDYRLQVEARDADGMQAEPLEFRFRVAAHWWQRPWAPLVGALLLLACGLAFVRWRLHAAGRRAAALEQEVSMRTQELAGANARLEQAAVTDPLTGLKNRRYFTLAAAAEAERALRAPAEQALLVVLLDIDHFKRINDDCGHDAGDAVLVEVARRLQRFARAGDIVLRWGGEEFLLLMRDIERNSAAVPLRRLLAELADSPVVLPAHRIEMTASIGAICYPPTVRGGADLRLEHAIAVADTALYRAKREGRDRAMLVDERAAPAGCACEVILRAPVPAPA